MNRLRLESHIGQNPTISRLGGIIAEHLKPYTELAAPFALLDFPNHPNVGDSAIWLGELNYFKAMMGSRPAFVCAKENFDADALKHTMPEGTLFLHGGGHFGDVWHELGYQLFRESILAQFPDRRIVQLPQTIHFSDSQVLERTAKAIEAHGKFILFVRDRRSFDIATASFRCPVHLAPDMAFCLGPLARPVKAEHPLLLLLRTDIESTRQNAGQELALPTGVIMADWLDEDPELYSKQKRRTLRTACCT